MIFKKIHFICILVLIAFILFSLGQIGEWMSNCPCLLGWSRCDLLGLQTVPLHHIYIGCNDRSKWLGLLIFTIERIDKAKTSSENKWKSLKPILGVRTTWKARRSLRWKSVTWRFILLNTNFDVMTANQNFRISRYVMQLDSITPCLNEWTFVMSLSIPDPRIARV